MKPATNHASGLLSRIPSAFAMLSLGITTLGLSGQASAIDVDSEILLLVDVSRSGLNNASFNSLMDSYAATFSSSQILNSIQSGTYGRIAVSLMFYGNSSVAQVGIPWMEIGNASQAAGFSSLLDTISRPFSNGAPDIANALTVASLTFGTETGALSNGFESNAQIIDVTASATHSGNVQATRDATLASGVDLINLIAVGNKADAIAAYFTANVIGSTISGVTASSVAFSANNPPVAALTAALTTEVTTTLSMGASAVPEPNTALSLMTSLGVLMLIRRRS